MAIASVHQSIGTAERHLESTMSHGGMRTLNEIREMRERERKKTSVEEEV